MLLPLNVWQRLKCAFPEPIRNGQKFCIGADGCGHNHASTLHVSETSHYDIISTAMISGWGFFFAASINHSSRNIENASFPTAFIWRS